MGTIYNNIIETIGRTPLVKLNRVTEGVDATILLKCEFFNPLGSVKDRIGMSMIDDAEKRSVINKDTTIIEPTKAAPMAATWDPRLPSPSRPRVFPFRLVPMHVCQRPLLTAASSRWIFRAMQ